MHIRHLICLWHHSFIIRCAWVNEKVHNVRAQVPHYERAGCFTLLLLTALSVHDTELRTVVTQQLCDDLL